LLAKDEVECSWPPTYGLHLVGIMARARDPGLTKGVERGFKRLEVSLMRGGVVGEFFGRTGRTQGERYDFLRVFGLESSWELGERILEDRVGGNGWDGMDLHGESPLGGWISGMICGMAAGFYLVAIFDSPSLFFKFSFSLSSYCSYFFCYCCYCYYCYYYCCYCCYFSFCARVIQFALLSLSRLFPIVLCWIKAMKNSIILAQK